MTLPFFDLPRPCVLGHRGAAGECPENTLTSFERALARGADVLESDLQLSRDGEAVLFHDATLERTTDGVGAVADHSLEALRRLDAAYHFRPAETVPRASAPPPYRGRGVRIPTLEEALSTFPEARFNLELKSPDPRLIRAVLRAVAKRGAADRVLLTAGDDGIMGPLRAAVAAAGAAIAIGASSREIGLFVRSALDGAAPPESLQALQVPTAFAGRPLVTRAFVDHAHRHGLVVHVWTINEAEEMHALFDLGVDGLVSDFPGRVVDCIEERRHR